MKQIRLQWDKAALGLRLLSRDRRHCSHAVQSSPWRRHCSSHVVPLASRASSGLHGSSAGPGLQGCNSGTSRVGSGLCEYAAAAPPASETSPRLHGCGNGASGAGPGLWGQLPSPGQTPYSQSASAPNLPPRSCILFLSYLWQPCPTYSTPHIFVPTPEPKEVHKIH